METQNYARWQFLSENRALSLAGWLPPAAEAPELGDLRAEHERLRAVESETLGDYLALQARRDAEEEARRAAQESEFLGKGPAGELPPITVGDEDLLNARVRAEAAKDAFQTFVREAVGAIKVAERDVLARLDETVKAADAKRVEAEALLAEADRMEFGTKRLQEWFARVTGRSVLGHLAWSDLPVPVPVKSYTFAEIAEAQNPSPPEVIELSPSFGTDDPDDLDNDSAAARPWEVNLTNA